MRREKTSSAVDSIERPGVAYHAHMFRALVQETHVFGRSVTISRNLDEAGYPLVKLWEVVQVFVYTPEHEPMISDVSTRPQNSSWV